MKIKETQLEYNEKYELSPEEIEAINIGLEDMKAGRGRPIEDFLKEMKGSLGI